ncbi:hypothetical protein [Glaciecola sp. SC05]|uniref:hypothetical protein n=1 Tax=Glaciecola sp. SC05 TaxID=1987355 RepID=UPI003526CC43
MRLQTIKRCTGTIVGITCAMFIAACSNQFSESIRKVTYPPDFKYTQPAELRSDMSKLAQQMVLLDSALSDFYEPNESGVELQRERVIIALKGMERTASKLKEGSPGGNHPKLQEQMQSFAAKVDQARNAASLQNPNYYYAGKVAGGCTNCHSINR